MTVVGSLAVDNEPEVFWAADGATAAEAIDAWKSAVGWRLAWGTVSNTGGNGTSGKQLRDRVLAPLGLDLDDVLLTDCVNTYFVHGDRRAGQRSALHRYSRLQDELAQPTAGIPARPEPPALVELAATTHRTRSATSSPVAVPRD
jgi:hypothetical protein